MDVQRIRTWVYGLRGTKLRGVLAASVGVYQTMRRRRANIFFVDADGDWVNWQREATFVSPAPHTSDARLTAQIVLDNWGYRYVPGPGDVVFDIGAGIGEETVIFSRLVGATGRVVSIEAHPRTFACLSKTVRRNRLTNVTLLNCAITSSDCEVAITDAGEHDHHVNTILEGARGSVAVRGRRLDDVADELGIRRIDLLKMNIEGAERLAIAGMEKSIRRTRFASISCHDFIADGGGSEDTRTMATVKAFLEAHDFDVTRRASEARPWVRDCLYAMNRQPVPGV